jgi:hypothetical protein
VPRTSKSSCSTSGFDYRHSPPRTDRAEAVLTIVSDDAVANLVVYPRDEERVSFRTRDGRIRERARLDAVNKLLAAGCAFDPMRRSSLFLIGLVAATALLAGLYMGSQHFPVRVHSLAGLTQRLGESVGQPLRRCGREAIIFSPGKGKRWSSISGRPGAHRVGRKCLPFRACRTAMRHGVSSLSVSLSTPRTTCGLLPQTYPVSYPLLIGGAAGVELGPAIRERQPGPSLYPGDQSAW